MLKFLSAALYEYPGGVMSFLGRNLVSHHYVVTL
jgi:hypothetical protein